MGSGQVGRFHESLSLRIFGYEEDRSCTCTPHQVGRYRSKIFGPLLDRFDIHIEVPKVDYFVRA
jgi:predicted ATPase with chaperone activity